MGEAVALDGLARCGVYADVLQAMVVAFKNGKTELDHVLCYLMDSAWVSCPFQEHVDVIVPVPLHWSRRLRRGYNQSRLLVRGPLLSGLTVRSLLRRTRRTAPQPTMKGEAARTRNVAGAFAVRRAAQVAGRTCCLIDDVKTSGATLHECARVLKAAGAKEVYALVLAVAGQRL